LIGASGSPETATGGGHEAGAVVLMAREEQLVQLFGSRTAELDALQDTRAPNVTSAVSQRGTERHIGPRRDLYRHSISRLPGLRQLHESCARAGSDYLAFSVRVYVSR
jgi:hypothetical protein